MSQSAMTHVSLDGAELEPPPVHVPSAAEFFAASAELADDRRRHGPAVARCIQRGAGLHLATPSGTSVWQPTLGRLSATGGWRCSAAPTT